ncbi:MAG: methyltransferase domain-containing protein [Phycisphaeraceae bacterium]|nr:methyltransferase domain-containing protein [Phycisphaeraceae bacterium]
MSTGTAPRPSASRRGPRTRDSIAFLREFIRHPGRIGAIAPSGRALAAAMVRGIDFRSVRAVVEFGPGTGVFTRAVLDAMPHDWLDPRQSGRAGNGRGRFIAIEFNTKMAAAVRSQYPEALVVNDDAANVEGICRREGIEPGTVDAIISGLAWTSIPEQPRRRILEATHRVLKPGGEFRTFTYQASMLVRSAWIFRRLLRDTFSEVHVGRVVWANMPPAFVYRCVK